MYIDSNFNCLHHAHYTGQLYTTCNLIQALKSASAWLHPMWQEKFLETPDPLSTCATGLVKMRSPPQRSLCDWETLEISLPHCWVDSCLVPRPHEEKDLVSIEHFLSCTKSSVSIFEQALYNLFVWHGAISMPCSELKVLTQNNQASTKYSLDSFPLKKMGSGHKVNSIFIIRSFPHPNFDHIQYA